MSDKKQILLLEDDVIIASGIEYALANEGYEVKHFGNVANAKESIESESYVLGLLDMQLPDGNGFQISELLKQKDIPVIFLTIVDDESKIVKAFEEGADDYMADISHQLKTPITSMLIMADLLDAANPEKQQEFIGNIKISLTKMEWLVSGLLKMAKLDSKAVEFHPTATKVSELVAAIKPSVEVLLDINSQTMQIEHDMEIVCDKRWTTEAFLNIVKNAIEHSKEGGSIVIDSGDNPIYQWISIQDFGEGMKEEQYAALFKRFEHSTNENGFGIGMPLALSIIRGQG